jgi:predicted small lipoprotein YifL
MRNQALTTTLYMLLFITLSISITGCGVKPKELDPPPGAEDELFPAQYPADN